MKIHLIAVGTKLETWLSTGYAEYAKRLPADYELKLIEIPAEKRSKHADVSQILQKEGEKILAAIPARSLPIALAVLGQQWDTPTLAHKLNAWHDDSQDISLIIGGPEGLSPACLNRCQLQWSLSKLTLPHPLVRVIVAEQIYRAYSIISNHPYHRN